MIIIATEEGIEVDGILLKTTAEIQVLIDAVRPTDLQVNIGTSLPYALNIFLHATGAIFSTDLQAVIGTTVPTNINIENRMYLQYKDMYVQIGRASPKDFVTFFRIFQTGYDELMVRLKPVVTSLYDLYLYMYVWTTKDLSVNLGMHSPKDITAYIWAWTRMDINVYIGTVYPKDIETSFIIDPEAGFDLNVIHRIFRTKFLSVDFDIWQGLKTLTTYLYGVYCDRYKC